MRRGPGPVGRISGASHASLLRRTSSVRILDWTCDRPHDSRPEAASRDEIVLVRSGTFRKRIGRRALVADPSTALFFPGGQEYRIDHPHGGRDRCVVLVLAPEILDEVRGRSRREHGRSFPADRASVSARACLLLRRLTRIAADGDPLEVDEVATLLAAEVLAGAEGHVPWALTATEAGHLREVEAARGLMAARHDEPLTLSEIARGTAYSPYHLARVFRRVTGRSLHEYLTRLRVLSALDRLEAGRGIAGVALDGGFSSHSHFTAAFRAELGAPPSRVLQDTAGASRTLSAGPGPRSPRSASPAGRGDTTRRRTPRCPVP